MWTNQQHTKMGSCCFTLGSISQQIAIALYYRIGTVYALLWTSCHVSILAGGARTYNSHLLLYSAAQPAKNIGGGGAKLRGAHFFNILGAKI